MKSSALTVPERSNAWILPVHHCPKCGGALDTTDECVECFFSEATSLSPEEAREFTSAGD